MHGNVWEWCDDAYPKHRSNGPLTAQIAHPIEGLVFGAERVMRGGAWHTLAPGLRSAYRISTSPALKYGGYGFRAACFLSLPDSKQNAK